MPTTIVEGERPAEERERRERDSSALRAAARRWWPEVPCASGLEIAWALRRVGLQAHLAGPDYIVLVQGQNEVGTVPLHDTVHPAILRALLHTLGVTPEELTAYLAEP
jgi:hypothetical protein